MVPINPTNEEMLDIARETISIFSEYGYECCLFGSLACVLYGVDRKANDVDLIILIKEDPENLKQRVVDEYPSRYSLKPPENQNPKKPFQKLYYTLPSSRPGRERVCKVDILVPGIMRIPKIPPQCIKQKSGFPILQVLPLLLLKLQGWSDRRRLRRTDFRRKKIPKDVIDITGLLEIACDLGTHLRSQSLQWLPKKNVEAAQNRVYRYVKNHPESAQKWERLGFDAHR